MFCGLFVGLIDFCSVVSWECKFDMPGATITPELKRDLQLLKVL